MKFDPEVFEKSNVDFGAIISEEFLNRFSDAHHRLNNEIYHIVQHISNFGINLDIKLDVNKPVLFNLDPIADDKFSRIWKSHLIVKGARKSVEPPVIPPNLKISVAEAQFTFIVYKEDGSIDFQEVFVWDISGVCAVVLDVIEGDNVLRIEPIKVEFAKHESELLKELGTSFAKINALKSAQSDSKDVALNKMSKNGDPEKLVLYLLNQILATQVTNFVQQFKLPKAYELIEGVTIEPGFLSISDHALAVGCKVGNDRKQLAENAEAEIRIFMNELRTRLNTEFYDFNEEKLKQWKIEDSDTFNWLNLKVEEYSKRNQIRRKAADIIKEYPENVIIFTNDELSDAVANQYFNFFKSDDYETTLIPLVLKAKCGWSVKLSNADTEITDHGLKFTMNAKFHGYAGVGAPNPDPKHWGEWVWLNLGITLWADPELGVIANPKFKSDGVYLGGVLTTQSIKANIDGVPSWANAAVAWISGLLTSPLFAIINLIVSQFDFKIIDYPTVGFPGTAIIIKPENWRLNESPQKIGSYLVFSADTLFM